MAARLLAVAAFAVLLLALAVPRAVARDYSLDDDFFIRRQQGDDPDNGGVTKNQAFNLEVGIKVIDGNPVFLPEVVKIELTSGGFCSGVAVATDRVLTAGHCGCAPRDSYVVRFPNEIADNGQYGFGKPYLLAADPVLFPHYDCGTFSAQPGRDLAILYLDRPSPVDVPPVAPMVYPFKDTAKRAFIAGYGRTEQGDYPRGLLGAFSTLQDPFCVRGNAFGSACAMFREFVLSDLVNAAALGTDTCDGDSGGPVYWFGVVKTKDGTEEIHRFLIGITSRALAGVPQFGATGCGGGGIYTAVGQVNVLVWLSQNGAPMEVGMKARRFAKRTIREWPRPPQQ
ncbi:S1 family peptidase [Mesorhizobium sp. B2-4-13]|uniref:S1 family peptidase n=1 Tax=Mesorhizobium sp. B2-4-13 TaxID=2589936 RepID=UPI0015EEB39C|nr:S1 family peptidase [Mesorhizobium sp. B2-4-13]